MGREGYPNGEQHRRNSARPVGPPRAPPRSSSESDSGCVALRTSDAMPMKVNSPLPQALPKECAKAAAIFKSFVDSGNNGLDRVIPRSVLENAKGFCILSVFKAGFLFSARGGSGVVIAKLDDGSWSAPSAIGTAGLGLGGQIGAEITDFLIVLNSRSAVRSFMSSGSVTLGGNMSVALGPLGRNGEALGSLNTSGKVAAMYSYSRSRGLFGGVSIEGSVIIERQDANAMAYHADVSAKKLLSGEIQPPEWASYLINTLDACTGAPGARPIPGHSTGPSVYHFGGVASPKAEKSSIFPQLRRKTKSTSTPFPPPSWGRAKDTGSYFDDPREGESSASPFADENAVAQRNRSATANFETQFESDFVPEGIPSPKPRWSYDSPLVSASGSDRRHTQSRSLSMPSDSDRQLRTSSVGEPSQATVGYVRPFIAPKPELAKPLLPHEGVARGIALYNFKAVQSGDLSFSKGDVITIVQKSDSIDDWWRGKIFVMDPKHESVTIFGTRQITTTCAIMSSSGKRKFYAVKIGRGGPAIYENWHECCDKVSRFPGAQHRSFASLQEAENWVGVPGCLQITRASTSGRPRSSSSFTTVFRGHSTAVRGKNNRDAATSKAPAVQHDSEMLPPGNGATSSGVNHNEKIGAPLPLPVVSASPVKLSPEQESVLQRVRDGQNVFFTGSAGTGKSVLLRGIINMLGGSACSTLGITASTGIAAVNIGGTTLHSWAGIGLGQEKAERIAGKIMYQPLLGQTLERWQNVKTLIIDEISMIDGKLFDKLEEVARMIRKSDKPFGGIQLILSGDFFQLPPVPNRIDTKQIPATFSFEAKKWTACIGRPVFLTHVFRQRDQSFVNMLNALRMGNSTPDIVAHFKSLSRAVPYSDGIEATELFPTRAEVERANKYRLDRLDVPKYLYPAFDTAGPDAPDMPQEKIKKLLNQLVAPESLELRVGAQVMMIKNIRQGVLVNGSLGRVISFELSNEGAGSVEGAGDAAALRNGVAKGTSSVPTPPPVVDAQEKPVHSSPHQRFWPRVLFQNGIEHVCSPEDFTVNNPDGSVVARRRQIPLILAWALSVHKSQGQTLERVKVNLARTFEMGQAYVALSRATKMECLQVMGFQPEKVKAHPRVLAWHGRIVEALRLEREEEEEEDMFSDEYEMMDGYI